METKIPLFNQADSMIPRDSWEDYIFILSEKNINRLKAVSPHQGVVADPKAVNFIFSVCDRLKYNADVKHTALAIFDLFTILHIDNMYSHTKESRAKRSKMKDWQLFEDKMASQVTLRILSCIQIASKIHFLPLSLTVKAARDFLRGLGHCYTLESVANSELRVLKTLDYNLNIVSPLNYIETLLKLLDGKTIDFERLYYWCVQVLDFVALEREELYKRLFDATVKSKTVERQQQIRIQNDYMLLSATIITAASYIMSGFEFAEKVATALHGITQIAADDLCDFCTVIVNQINIRANS